MYDISFNLIMIRNITHLSLKGNIISTDFKTLCVMWIILSEEISFEGSTMFCYGSNFSLAIFDLEIRICRFDKKLSDNQYLHITW